MAMKSFMKQRMYEFIKGGPAWKGVANYARDLVSGPPMAPPGAPPGMRRETGPDKPTWLRKGIRGKISAVGKRTVVGRVFSIAHRGGAPYPLFLEYGMTVNPHPWLKPTFEVAKKKMFKVWSREPNNSEWNQIKSTFQSKVRKAGVPKVGKLEITF